jgi:hypothetical protein
MLGGGAVQWRLFGSFGLIRSYSRVTKPKPPSVPLAEGAAAVAAGSPMTLGAGRTRRRWRRGPALPVLAAAAAVATSAGLLYWLWQVRGQSALPASTASFAPDPDPPIIPPPAKELIKPSPEELPGRMSLEKSIDLLLREAPAIADVKRQISTNPRIGHWEIRFPAGNTLEMYARQLDALGIELGVIGGSDRIAYASGFTKETPDRRDGRAEDELRFYMTWRSGAQRGLDNALLSRAGIATSDRIVAQFYPPPLERTLAELERQFAGKRGPSEVRRTVFALEPVDKSFEFRVVEQEYVSGELKRK